LKQEAREIKTTLSGSLFKIIDNTVIKYVCITSSIATWDLLNLLLLPLVRMLLDKEIKLSQSMSYHILKQPCAK